MIGSQPVRILLVEDDQVDRMAVERLFAKESLPYDLVVATTVAEATSRLREDGIGLVLIDHKLPDGSGLDVQQEAAGTPSIFITAADDLSVAVEAMKAGAADFLVKDGARQYLQLLPLTIESTLKQQENVRARRRAEEALHRAHDELEVKVRQRTAELTATVDRLNEEIQERKQAEEELRQFKYIVSSSNDMLALLDKNFVYLTANEAYLRAFGKTSDELIGHTVSEILGEEFFEKTIRPNAERCLAGEEVHYQNWVDFPLLGRQYMDVAYFPFFGLDKEVKGFVVRAQDITERKQAEAALRDSEEKYRALFEQAADSIMLVDTQTGALVEFNDTAHENLGYTREEFQKLKIPDFEAVESAEEVDKHLEKMVSEGADVFDTKHRTKTGEIKDILVSSKAISIGGKSFALSTGRDITERKRAEEALQRAHDELEERVEARTAALASANEQLYLEMKERERTEEALLRSQRLASMGTMAAGIAHEINNPLHGIALASEIALQQKDGPQGSQTVDEMLRKIQEEAMRCGRITRGVLQFARQETSEKWPGSLADGIRRAKDLTRQPAQDKHVRVRLELSDSLPLLTINPTEMEQVFVNLIGNAIEASEPGDCVTVRADVVSDAVRVLVEDRGCGMTKEQTDHIFDPFFTTRQEAGGTGLGLSVTHGIIEGHGGTICAQSSPGQGSVFTLVLPLQLPTTKGAENAENPDR